MSKPDIVIDSMQDFITVTVSISSGFRLRLWLALQLFRLGAWIAQWNIELEDLDE